MYTIIRVYINIYIEREIYRYTHIIYIYIYIILFRKTASTSVGELRSQLGAGGRLVRSMGLVEGRMCKWLNKTRQTRKHKNIKEKEKERKLNEEKQKRKQTTCKMTKKRKKTEITQITTMRNIHIIYYRERESEIQTHMHARKGQA